MDIAFVASLQFHKHTGARTRATRLYSLLSQNHSVTLFNVNTFNEADVPDDIDGYNLAPGSSRLPATAREVVAGLKGIRLFNKGEYDLVWSYNSWQHTPVISWTISSLFHVPLLVGINDPRSGSGVKGLVVNEWLRKHVQSVADCLVLETEDLGVEPRSIGVPHERIVVVPTGIDVSAFAESEVPEAEVPTVFYVGRANDIDLLFDTAPIVASEFPEVEFRIAGVDREEHPEVTDDRIEFLGYVDHDDLVQEMHRSHVCVVPYRRADTAGRPAKLLEYMSAEKCIVATDYPYNTQMIEHDRNGLIASPDPEAFARALCTALGDDELRHRLAKQAFADVQPYSLESLHDSVETALRVAKG